jgi:uncharacterized phage protein (TIGR02220 family)
MKWFKHDTDASADAKIKKLLIKHGAIGYAIYFHCLELIASDISETNITFELEHDAEIIADNLKIKGTADKSGIEIVSEIMIDIISLGLFECYDNRIFCFKLLKRLDTSMTSSSKMRSLITEAKHSHDKVMTESCKTRLDKTRREETRRDKNSPAYTEIIDYLNSKANTSYRHTTGKTRELIHARCNEGFTLDDFKTVIDKKCSEWMGTEFQQYIRPQTLFGTKFEAYLNQKEVKKTKTQTAYDDDYYANDQEVL